MTLARVTVPSAPKLTETSGANADNALSATAVPAVAVPAERLTAVLVATVALPASTANFTLPSGQRFLIDAWKLGTSATMVLPVGTSPSLKACPRLNAAELALLDGVR